MPSDWWIARNLAAALLGGAWTERALNHRFERFFRARSKAARRKLMHALWSEAPGPIPPSVDELTAFLADHPSFEKAAEALRKSAGPINAVLTPPRFAPAERFKDLDIPRLATIGELAAWLDLPLPQLDWLADRRQQQGKTGVPALQHYRQTFIPKRSGPPRLIEEPKPRLKAIQRKILAGILDLVPTHPAAHGFVRERSCVTAAAAHASENVVLTVDLKDFFLKTRISRVHALFRNLGYPEQTARALTGLVTTATPLATFQRLPDRERHSWETQKTFNTPHLPQGTPTSPALANLAAFTLDTRIAGLARRFGVTYTRYADDLAFSGGSGLQARADVFLASVSEITTDERYALNPMKTHLMTRATRQQVTGLVVNDRVNIDRVSYDRLKAILTNCVRHGPADQNRESVHDFRAHLNGRIGWVTHINPARGAKLRQIYSRIDWQS